MTAVYLFLLSLMVFWFAMYVYENDRNMMQLKLEFMYSIKEKNKEVNIIREDIDDTSIKLDNAVKTIANLEEYLKKEKILTCPHGWIMQQLNCYIFIKTPKTWKKAADDCVAKQAKLIKISGSWMNSWVASQIKDDGIDGIWIGLNDRRSEGEYVWHGDSSTSTYESWRPGQPDGKIKQNCVFVDDKKLWWDIRCSLLIPYACEKKMILKIK